MNLKGLRPRVGDLRQLASVRRVVLDDGAERGVRALAFSTGGGLDFWVLSDRSLDIGPLWWRGVPLAWQAPGGFRSPALADAESEAGFGFNRSFSGFLVTCGLDHIRQPADGQPLHGRLPFTPARVTAYGEDWDSDPPVLFCQGEMIQARYGGEALRLRRRIEAPVGGGEIRLHDEVENIGGRSEQQAILYHFNLGYPAIDTGTMVRAGDDVLLGPVVMPRAGEPPPAASRPVGSAARASCVVTTPAGSGDFSMAIGFDTGTLPHLQTWSDLRPHAGIVAIEPCTSARGPDGRSGPEAVMAPGDRRVYTIDVSLAGYPPRIDPSVNQPSGG